VTDVAGPSGDLRGDDPGAESAEGADGVAPPRSHVARNSALVVGAVLALFIAVLATRKPPEDVKNQLVGRRVPALVGTTLDGRRLDVDNLRGKWVVVNFLASWCVGCVEEHPDLLRFARQHAEDVQIVGVAYNDDAASLREFFRVKGGNWPVIVAEGNSAYDFGVTGVPESFVVRPDGLVVAWSQGVTFDWLNEVLAASTAPEAPR
jgi:cytochrome c biogenesis protein CcmG/thiol:disulfide interchange protein DsbE